VITTDEFEVFIGRIIKMCLHCEVCASWVGRVAAKPRTSFKIRIYAFFSSRVARPYYSLTNTVDHCLLVLLDMDCRDLVLVLRRLLQVKTSFRHRILVFEQPSELLKGGTPSLWVNEEDNGRLDRQPDHVYDVKPTARSARSSSCELGREHSLPPNVCQPYRIHKLVECRSSP